MKPLATAVVLCCLLPFVSAAFKCDKSQKSVGDDGQISMPCTYSMLGLATFTFTLKTKECSKEFTISGEYKAFFQTHKFSFTVDEEHNTVQLTSIGMCNVVRFDQITTSEDGISFCPVLVDCAAPGTLSCISIAAEDTCPGHTDCASCAKDADCGWCYTTQSCLPANEAHTSDRCELCEDFSFGTCPGCTDNCAGHGLCEQSGGEWQCKCEEGWTGASTCDVYIPSTGTRCANVAASSSKLRLSKLANKLYHQVISFGADRVSVLNFKLLSDRHSRPKLYFRRGQPVSESGYDVLWDPTLVQTSDLDIQNGFTVHKADKGCASEGKDGAQLLSFVTPPIDVHEDLWIATPEEGVEIFVGVDTCTRGFYGGSCGIPESDVDPQEEDHVLLNKVLPKKGVVKRKVSREITLKGGTSHFISFPVYPETTRLSATMSFTDVSEGSDELTTLKAATSVKLHRDGKEIHYKEDPLELLEIHEPIESKHWGVVVSLESSVNRFAGIQLSFEFDECYTDSDADVEACGPPVEFLTTTTEGVAPSSDVHYTGSFAFLPGESWVVATLPMKPGRGKVVIKATTDLPDFRLYARYRAPPVLSSSNFVDAAQSEGGHGVDTITLIAPEAGYWFVGVHKMGGRSSGASQKVSITATASYCSGCSAEHCALDSTVMATQCSGAGCAPGVSEYPIPRCVADSVPPPPEQPVVGGGGGPQTSPETPATGGSTGGNGGDGGGGGGDASAGQTLVVGIGIGVLAVAAGAGGMYFMSILAVKRDQRRRETGGYQMQDIPTLDDDVSLDDIMQDDVLEPPAPAPASAPGDQE